MTEAGHPAQDYLAPVREAVLAAALPHVPFDGWSDVVLERAIQDAGADAGLALLAFPDGVRDLLGVFWASRDTALVQEISFRNLHNLRLSARVTEALKIYLELLRPHREAVRRALAVQALPPNVPGALAQLYRTVDAIWRAAGDQSTDFNFYSKRAVLAAVVASIVTHWLGEGGTNAEAMDAFIERRVANVLQFEKVKARLGALSRHVPSPAPLLGRLAARLSGARRWP
ncbi:MAG: COQ9 family protein [Alphaproteobacteria bacterium]|nr:COQ9 family protein [Alphaproteobacteria bacterium]